MGPWLTEEISGTRREPAKARQKKPQRGTLAWQYFSRLTIKNLI
jgi:hypothetical protein